MAGLPEYMEPSACRHLEHGAVCNFSADPKPRPSDCPGTCPGAVKQNPVTDRWFITFGHAGFNSPANNRGGYSSRARALSSHRRYRGAN